MNSVRLPLTSCLISLQIKVPNEYGCLQSSAIALLTFALPGTGGELFTHNIKLSKPSQITRAHSAKLMPFLIISRIIKIDPSMSDVIVKMGKKIDRGFVCECGHKEESHGICIEDDRGSHIL